MVVNSKYKKMVSDGSPVALGGAIGLGVGSLYLGAASASVIPVGMVGAAALVLLHASTLIGQRIREVIFISRVEKLAREATLRGIDPKKIIVPLTTDQLGDRFAVERPHLLASLIIGNQELSGTGLNSLEDFAGHYRISYEATEKAILDMDSMSRDARNATGVPHTAQFGILWGGKSILAALQEPKSPAAGKQVKRMTDALPEPEPTELELTRRTFKARS